MVDTQSIDNALSLDSLNLPPIPRIVKIAWDWYEDSSNEESLEVFVVLDDATTDTQIERAPIHEIKRTIAGSLEKNGVRLFPYFYFERESEHETPRHA
ncbi:MAG: hypothetical protein GXX96_06775 [Planctomycetaceae bacterium]|nr:hypothetical protein [Planctomycetaceae bacterium]